MRARRTLGMTVACAAVVAGPDGSILPARADAIGGDLPLDGFRPALDARGFVTVDGGEVLAPGEPSFGLVTTWSRGLLDLGPAGAGSTYRVEDVVAPTLVAGIGLPRGIALAIAVPFGVVAADRGPDDDGGTPTEPADDDDGERGAQGIGDVAIDAKVRVLDRRAWAIAVAGGVTLPTATAGRWLGSGAVAGGARAIVEWRGGRWRLAGNVGVWARAGGDAVFVDDGGDATGVPPTGMTVAMGPSIPAGAAAAWAIAPGRLEVIAELGGRIPLGGDVAPVEAIGAVRVRLAEASHFTIGAGTGLGDGAGNPDVRAFAAIRFEPRRGRAARTRVADPPARRAPPPPGDRDDDTFPDPDDACPDDPEDLDGFADDDGCPDVDSDGDGLRDVDELCPDDPEDLDGIQDDDGCPEVDADGDGILDTDDGCPLERESRNDHEDDDGCDDRGRVRVGDGTLDVFEEIHFEFDSAAIQERSHDILRVIARTLALNPDLRLVEIGGHTDDRGPDAYNLDLSRRRAEAVRQFLVDEGVEEDRLTAEGYGETAPKVRRKDAAARAANRRVEFVILRRSP